MCGIAGILSFNRSIDHGTLVRQMTDAIAHRGPDAAGYFTDDQVSLGHRRLSIIDLSDAANQPLVDHTGRYQIIFNGEIYNYRELKNLLRNYPFRTNSDTEALLAAYEKWGPDCLQYIKGMFVFVIWDTREKTLFIARDRLGVKPLYYYTDHRCFVFASEVRSVLASGLMPRKANRSAIREFLSYQSVGSPLSPVENIRQLEAGCWCMIRQGNIANIFQDSPDRRSIFRNKSFFNDQFLFEQFRYLEKNFLDTEKMRHAFPENHQYSYWFPCFLQFLLGH